MLRVVALIGMFQVMVCHRGTARAEDTCNDDRSQCCAWWSVEVKSANGPTGMILEDSFDKLQRRLVSDKETGAKLCRYFGPSDSSCSTTYGAPTCAMGNQPSKCDGAAAAFDQWADQLQRDLTNVAKLEHPYTKLRDAAGAWGQQRKAEAGRDLRGRVNAEVSDYAKGKLRPKVKDAVELAETTHHDDGGNPFEHVGTVLADYKDGLSEALQRVRTAQAVLGRVVKQGPLFINPYMSSLGDPTLLSLWNTRGGFAGADEKDAANCEVVAVEQAVAEVRKRGVAVGRIPVPSELPIRDPIDKVTIAKQSKSSRLVVGDWKVGKTPPVPGRYPIAWVDARRKAHYDVAIDTVDGPEGRTRMKVTAGPPNDPTIIYFDGPAPDRDGDGFIDVRDRCPDEVGRAPGGCPPTCHGGRYWTGDTCACPDERPRWRGGRCEACPTATEWNGDRCVRPEPVVVKTAPAPVRAAPVVRTPANRCAGVTIVPDARPCDEFVMAIFRHQHGPSVGCATFLVHNMKGLTDEEAWCVIDKMPPAVLRPAANVKARPQHRSPGNVCQLGGFSAGGGPALWACATLP